MTKFNLSFIQSCDWLNLINDWIAYRKEIKKPCTQRIINSAYKFLQKESNGNIEIARLITEQSIRNGWQGLFRLPKTELNEYGFNKESVSEHRMQQEFAETLARKMGSRNT